MDIRFYLAPYGPGYLPQRPLANTSKVHLYVDTGAGESYMLVKANPWKNWCLSYVDASEATHTACQGDAEIKLIPFYDAGMNYLPLSATVSDVVEPHRTNIASFMENHRIPTGWISGGTTLGRVLRYIIQILLTVQRLKDDFPEIDLDAQLSAVSPAQRNRIRSWMNNSGIDTGDFTGSWTVRQVLARIVRDYGWQPVYQFGTALL